MIKILLWDEDLVCAGQGGGEGIYELILDQTDELQLPLTHD